MQIITNLKNFRAGIVFLATLVTVAQPVFASDGNEMRLSPAAVGWGNLLVPGLGATLRGLPGRGLLEASLEIGTYYGGTFGVHEGGFTIDGSVVIPTSGNLYGPVAGQLLQEFGLKLHMFDTFYHYQQAAIDQADTDNERNNPQPLYRGNWKDVLEAPFEWKNLSSPWVYPLLIVSSVFQIYSYSSTSVAPTSIATSPGAETFYGASQIAAVPLGSAFGEEVLFRGFIQREVHGYSKSLAVAVLSQTLLFGAIHPPELRPFAFAGGIYYGLMVHQLQGDLEPAIASHFWIDVVNGLTTYWAFRRTQGKDAPFSPPIGMQITIPF